MASVASGVVAGPGQRSRSQEPPPPRPRQQPTPRQLQHARLASAYKRVKTDCDRLVGLAGELRAETARHRQNPLTPALVERVQVLEGRVQELRKSIEAVDENFLSVVVVTTGREIKDEARALDALLAKKAPGKAGERMRQLARGMGKLADSIADRMRFP